MLPSAKYQDVRNLGVLYGYCSYCDRRYDLKRNKGRCTVCNTKLLFCVEDYLFRTRLNFMRNLFLQQSLTLDKMRKKYYKS